MRKFILGGLLAAGLCGPSLAQQAAVQVTVDTSRPGAPIDRRIYGQFAEHLGHGIYEGIWVGEKSPIPNIHGYRKDVVEALVNDELVRVEGPYKRFAEEQRIAEELAALADIEVAQ